MADDLRRIWRALRGTVKERCTFAEIKDLVASAVLPVEKLSHLQQKSLPEKGASKSELMDAVDGLIDEDQAPDQAIQRLIAAFLQRKPNVHEEVAGCVAQFNWTVEDRQLRPANHQTEGTSVDFSTGERELLQSAHVMSQRTKVFISYSRRDAVWLTRFQEVLAPLERDHSLDVWSDARIDPGKLWKQEVETALAEAKVALLLVSPPFLASQFIADNELPPLLDAAATQGVRILWVPVSASFWKRSPIEPFQSAWNPDQPLDTLTTGRRAQALVKIVEALVEAAEAPLSPQEQASGTVPDNVAPEPEPLATPPAVIVRPGVPPALAAYLAEMCDVPGGTFQMGGDGPYDGKPIHSVTLTPFRLGRTPVTVALWKEYVAATGLMMPPAPDWGWLDDHPIVNVAWNDTQRFCVWASEVSGIFLSLPTEAQWEYAARGSLEGKEYPWGDGFDRSKLWCSKHSIGDAGGTTSVGRARQIYVNKYDLIDMVGNASEWCSDFWSEGAYFATPDAAGPDPMGPSAGDHRVIRSSTWKYCEAAKFHSAFREWGRPAGKSIFIGFRLLSGSLRV